MVNEYHGRGYNRDGCYLVRLDEAFRPVFTSCSTEEYAAMDEVFERRAAEYRAQLQEVSP